MELEPGSILNNRYRIDGRLGQGGMGVVYRGFDQVLKIPVAIKENLNPGPDSGSQFEREAVLLAKLRHPNLPRVTDHFLLGDQQYLVMDYVEGEDLRTITEGKRPSVEEVLSWADAVCDALAYLHSRQPPVIHRDIKPANIKLQPDGRVALVDFGIAKEFLGQTQATTTGARGLTPGYSPLEQYSGAGTDARSDQYALAATLYALLAGRQPPDSLERMMKRASLRPVRELNPQVPPRADAAIQRALALNKEDRFPDIAHFREALREPRPAETVPAPPPKAKRSLGWLVALGGIGTLILGGLLLAAIVVGVLVFAPRGQATPTPDVAVTAGVPAGAVGRTTGELASATVQILALADMGGTFQPVWRGSGSIISPDGLILTNGHVVDDRSRGYDRLGVAVTRTTDQPPELAYLAEIAAVHYDLDLAVVRIISDLAGNPVTLGDLPYVVLGDSDTVEIGDRLRILGYPGIGGQTITFTEGAVSGFTGERQIDGRAWIKTDATIAGGNSGGMGVNERGELIGVPTTLGSGAEEAAFADCRQLVDTNRDGIIDERDTCVPLGGFINALRPVNLARPLIEAAQRGEAFVVGREPPTSPIGGFDLSQTSFSNLVFSDGVTPDNRPLELWYALPAGSTRLCAFWDYVAMADGMTWSAYWFVDGGLSEGGSTIAQTWGGGPSGNWWVCIFNDPGLRDGLYELVLEVEGEVLATDSIYVGGGRSVVELRLINQSRQTICFVQLSPSEAQNWGPDELGPQEVIGPGGERTFVLASGTYDLRLLDCQAATLREDHGHRILQGVTYTFTD